MPRVKPAQVTPASNRKSMPANEDAMVADCQIYIQCKKKGVRLYPTDHDTITYLINTYRLTYYTAVGVLKAAKAKNAELINALMPTLGQNTIADLREIQQEARRIGDLGTAGRIGIALGRFCGLDGPQSNPEAQVRQLSDAALEAALEASIARKLESMPDDQLSDLMKRREQKRLAGAKPAALEPQDVIEAGGTEVTG